MIAPAGLGSGGWGLEVVRDSPGALQLRIAQGFGKPLSFR